MAKRAVKKRSAKQGASRDRDVVLRQVPGPVLDRLDQMAEAFGMSRSKFLLRLLDDVVMSAEAAEASPLFKAAESMWERAIDQAFKSGRGGEA